MQKVDKETQEDIWYEFNDIWVREFDKNEIPQECFGGEETSYTSGWNAVNTKYMKMRNAYLLVYKRKLQGDTSIYEEEEGPQPGVPADKKESSKEDKEMKEEPEKFKLGQMELKLTKDSAIYQKIAAENHKYWQNRFLFGNEYHEFVGQITLHWNSSQIIPAITPCRNPDQPLLDPLINTIAQQYGHLEAAQKPMQILLNPHEQHIDLRQEYSAEQLQQTQLQVFKFAARFYVTILQRASDK